MSYHPFARVHDARPAPINDKLLAQLTLIAKDVPNSLASEAECEWLLSTLPALLDELIQRRAFMAGLDMQLPRGNVIALPGSR